MPVIGSLSSAPFGALDPIYFVERFGLSPVRLTRDDFFLRLQKRESLWMKIGSMPQAQTGTYLASLSLLQTFFGTFIGGVETALIKAGWRTIDVR